MTVHGVSGGGRMRGTRAYSEPVLQVLLTQTHRREKQVLRVISQELGQFDDFDMPYLMTRLGGACPGR